MASRCGVDVVHIVVATAFKGDVWCDLYCKFGSSVVGHCVLTDHYYSLRKEKVRLLEDNDNDPVLF